MDKAEKNKRKLVGTVVSDRMDKTVVVKVTRFKKHAKYKKSFHVYKNFKAHDENKEYHTGDSVVIEETKPFSKDKRWRVLSKISKS
ncbi:MAG: 30S ribosomal protein S17 [Patescibacteria group bacterium]